MILLLLSLVMILAIGNIHYYQLSKSYEEVIEEQNKIIKKLRL